MVIYNKENLCYNITIMNDFARLVNPKNTADMLWVPDADGFEIPDAVERVAFEFNHTPFRELASMVRSHVSIDENGIEVGIWDGENEFANEYSSTEAVVMFSTFATRIDTNFALRGQFCHDTFSQAGIRDSEGKKLPVYFFAAPAGDATIPLTKNEIEDTAKRGDLSHIARSQLMTLRNRGFAKVALLGMSQGGAIAAAGSRIAPEIGMDVTNLGIASSPNTHRRLSPFLIASFINQGKYLREDLEKGGIDAFIKVHKEEYNEIKYALAMLSQSKLNFAIFRALAKDRLLGDLAEGYSKNPNLQTTTAVATGQNDGVGNDKKTRYVVERIRDKASSVNAATPHHITIQDGHHSWGDRLKLLATFKTYALSLRRQY